MFVIILIYLCALYLSLPLGPYLVREGNIILGARGIMILSYLSYLVIFFTFMLFLNILLTFSELKTKKGEIVLFLVLIASSFLFLHDISLTPCERLHILEYGILGLMFYFYFAGDQRLPAVKAFASLFLAGALDEIFQAFLPNRVGEVKDVILNVIGGLWGIMLSRWFLTLRKNRVLIK